MRRLTATTAAVAAVATLGIGAGSAFAASSGSSPAPATSSTAGGKAGKTPATLQEVQAKATAAVTDRVNALNAEIAKIQAATWMGGDQAAVLKTLQGDVPALQQLGQKIAADTTLATAAADYRTIFSNYRVFALALPAARLVSDDDRITNAAVAKLTAIEGKLQARVTPATSAQITPLLADMQKQITAASTAAKGLNAQLLALTPSSWNANHAVLTGPRSALKGALGDLKAARSDASQARADLKAARGAAHHAHTGSGTTPAPAPSAGAPAGA